MKSRTRLLEGLRVEKCDNFNNICLAMKSENIQFGLADRNLNLEDFKWFLERGFVKKAKDIKKKILKKILIEEGIFFLDN